MRAGFLSGKYEMKGGVYNPLDDMRRSMASPPIDKVEVPVPKLEKAEMRSTLVSPRVSTNRFGKSSGA